MQSVLAALTGAPDRFPARAAEVEPRREPSNNERGFDDAFAERAAAREPQRANAERHDREKREEGDGQSDAAVEKPHPRSEGGRRSAAQGASPASRNKVTESAEPSLVEIDAAPASALFDAEILAESVVVATVDPTEESAGVIANDAAETLTPSADGDTASSSAPNLLVAPLAAPIEAVALDSEPESVVAFAPAAAPRLAPIIETAPAPQQAVSPAAATVDFAVIDRARAEEFGKAEEAQPASSHADGVVETTSALEPARVEAPLTTQVKPKEKSALTRAGIEGLQDLGAPQERIAHQPTAQAAAEVRAAPTNFSASVEAASQVIAAIRADKGSKEIDVRLDPPELGRVKISFSFERSDIVTATVSSERTDTLDLLRRHQEDLARELERAGFSKVRLDFSANDSGRGFSEQSAPQAWREAAFGDDPIEDVRVHYLSLRTDNRLDRLV
jgi:flagellar hook-length control protein FliK